MSQNDSAVDDQPRSDSSKEEQNAHDTRTRLIKWLDTPAGVAFQAIYRVGGRLLFLALPAFHETCLRRKIFLKPMRLQDEKPLEALVSAASETEPAEFIMKAFVPKRRVYKTHDRLVVSTEAAFLGEYVGSTALLQSQIQAMFGKEKHCSNVFTMVQGSGTGKSRLVHELARTVFTFPICVREDQRRPSSYPPPDIPVRDFFEEHSRIKSDSRLVALCFLWALIERGSQDITGLTPAEWHELFSNTDADGLEYRDEFYQSVVKLASERFDNSATHDNLIRDLVAAYSALREANNIEYALICFDGVHTILDNVVALTQVFHCLRAGRVPVAAIYLSTHLEIWKVLPPARWETLDNFYTTPFTELPLDIWAKDKIPRRIQDCYLSDIRKHEVAASLGRPMWTAQLKGGLSPTSMAEHARHLLVRRNNGELEEATKHALLCCCLAINLNSLPSSRRLAEELVASHMATVFFVNTERTEFKVGYPPEPVISSVAAKVMTSERGFREKHSWIPWLHWMIGRHFISRDNRRQLVSRAILTLARDKAYVDPADDVVLSGHEPVSLKEFLRHLVGPKWDELKTMKPYNLDATSSKTLDDFIGEHAVIDFTCFTTDNGGGIFTYQGMLAALIQGAAVICDINQKPYDHALVWVIDSTKPLTRNNLGIILEHAISTGQNATTTYLAPHTIEGLKDFPIISIGHGRAQPIKVTPFPGYESHCAAETEQPCYHITLDGTELLEPKDLTYLLNGDDPLATYGKEGEAGKEGEEIILQHKRLYGVRKNGELSFMEHILPKLA